MFMFPPTLVKNSHTRVKYSDALLAKKSSLITQMRVTIRLGETTLTNETHNVADVEV